MREQVAAAAARWLDTVKPGWAHRVNVGQLDMLSKSCCVLGQAFSDNTAFDYGYTYALQRAGGNAFFEQLQDIYGNVAIGVFCAETFKEYWLKEIADRVCATPVPEPQPEPELVGV